VSLHEKLVLQWTIPAGDHSEIPDPFQYPEALILPAKDKMPMKVYSIEVMPEWREINSFLV
jgi:hypothetical protein